MSVIGHCQIVHDQEVIEILNCAAVWVTDQVIKELNQNLGRCTGMDQRLDFSGQLSINVGFFTRLVDIEQFAFFESDFTVTEAVDSLDQVEFQTDDFFDHFGILFFQSFGKCTKAFGVIVLQERARHSAMFGIDPDINGLVVNDIAKRLFFHCYFKNPLSSVSSIIPCVIIALNITNDSLKSFAGQLAP
ncbi:hypothetical protein D3C71_1449560 [compost metagenome]